MKKVKNGWQYAKIVLKLECKYANRIKNQRKRGDNLKKLRELRKARRLTLAEVANAIGIKQQVLSYYERGDREPRVETLKKLAMFYGVSIDYLVSD